MYYPFNQELTITNQIFYVCRMNKTYIFLFAFLVIGLTSCSDRPVISISQSINGDWNYDSPLIYSLDIQSDDTVYDLILELTYSTDFNYQNIYVNIETQYPNGEKVDDVISINLTDGAGTFLGNCNNKECDIEILLQEKFKFKDIGTHIISISQHSRKENIPGISEGKLKLFKRKKSN